jgi:transcriptional regulator with XRE-family HTH domain
MKLDEKLVSLRKEKGMTQLKVAEELNVSRQAISRWESGIAMPSTENLKCLSELYGVPVDALLNDGINLPKVENDPQQEQLEKEKRKNSRLTQVILVSALILIAIIVTGISIIGTGNKNKDDEIISLEEMETDKGDDLPSESFTVGW